MTLRVGKIQRKILILLFGGLSLAFAGSPRRQLRVLRDIDAAWREIDCKALHQATRALYRSRLVNFRERGDGKIEAVLTKEGKQKTLIYNLDALSVKKPARWDGRWRMVCFDIPQDKKAVRDAFRFHLQRLGFHSLQKSLFVFPYPCEDEIDFLVECYEVRPYVRQIVAQDIDSALHLKSIFRLQ